MLAGEKPKPLGGGITRVACEEMASIFELSRREFIAAVSIQRHWRRWLVRRAWKVRTHQLLQLVKIQSAARGYLTRRLVAAW